MLIATFGPTTAWVGKQITHEGGAFVLEGHGPISAADIMEYDRQGHLLWVDEGVRAWVGSKAKQSKAQKAKRAMASSPAASTATVTPNSDEPRAATRDTGSQPSSRKKTYLKRALLLAIAVLIVANVVLVLILAGVFAVPSQGVDQVAVGKWRARFASLRLAGLRDEPRPGAPRTISDADVERVPTKTLEEAPRDATHFTPTYSFWPNPVERWFAELTERWLRRGSHRSNKELVASIRT